MYYFSFLFLLQGSLESSLGALQKDFDSAKLLYSTSSTSLSEEKAQLHKQMEAHKKQLKLSEAEFEAEKVSRDFVVR